jgi:hypothetical protein
LSLIRGSRITGSRITGSRIRGSGITGWGISDSVGESAIFAIELQNAIKMFFCLLLSEGTFTSFFKDKKSNKVTKQ